MRGDSGVTLYEYVTDEVFEEADSLGIDIERGSVNRVVGDPDTYYEIPVTAAVEDGRQAAVLKDGATVATAVFDNGEATLQIDESDVDPDAYYVVVALDGTDGLGATPLLAWPASKDQCMDGGWEEYGFSNQGQCIRFVNTGKDGR